MGFNKFLMLVFFFIFLFFLFLLFIWLLWNFLSFFFYNRESSSPFECGFSGSEGARSSFSFFFFKMVVLFLVFDLEIILLVHLPLWFLKLVSGFMSYLLFLLIMLFGTIEEWRRGFLDWY